MAFHDGRAVSVALFAAHVRDLAARLPDTTEVINLCEDRYLFTVGFAAALSVGATTLLPPGRNNAAVHDLKQAHAGAPAVGDRLDAFVDVAVGAVPGSEAGGRAESGASAAQ